jgi:ADP-ribose pyrophosphatase YjhB (NUDIX family)
VTAGAFCGSCGARLTTREIEGREREVCPACGAIAYRNPLPVAAAVLLDGERRALLVRRKKEPQAGTWCLPGGFAELGETIDQAAVRELREETGLAARISRLLTARSAPTDFYGDLLFICFEVEQTGGDELPGDDAEALGWFPLSSLPPLAFAAHTEALAVCEALHREPWAIQDSFTHLYSDSGEGMLSDALVALVEEHAEEICRRWLAQVHTNPTTPTYARLASPAVRGAALEALSRFCSWLQEPSAERTMEAFYFEIGRARARQGYPLAEVLSALTLLRKEIWAFAREHQVLASPLDVYRVMELSRRIVLFFDKAIFHTARGFLREQAKPAPDGG